MKLTTMGSPMPLNATLVPTMGTLILQTTSTHLMLVPTMGTTPTQLVEPTLTVLIPRHVSVVAVRRSRTVVTIRIVRRRHRLYRNDGTAINDHQEEKDRKEQPNQTLHQRHLHKKKKLHHVEFRNDNP